MLPTEAKARKDIPVASGVLDYFKDAITAVAAVSKLGGEQHNPGKPLQWDRSKSGDESDALMRHFLERGTLDSDGARHSAKVAWRALALLQKEIEAAVPMTATEVLERQTTHFAGYKGPYNDPNRASRWRMARADSSTWDTENQYYEQELSEWFSSKPVVRLD